MQIKKELYQSFPYSGTVTTLTDAPGPGGGLVPIASAANGEVCTDLTTGGGCGSTDGVLHHYFVRTESAVSVNQDLNGAVTSASASAVGHDTDGNVVASVTTVGLVNPPPELGACPASPSGQYFCTQTNNTYGVEDVPNWLLGRLTSTTVVEQSP